MSLEEHEKCVGEEGMEEGEQVCMVEIVEGKVIMMRGKIKGKGDDRARRTEK